MRDRTGKFTNAAKQKKTARLYWLKGFSQGYDYSSGRTWSFTSASFFGRFAQTYAYGLQRGRSAGYVARCYGVHLGDIE